MEIIMERLDRIVMYYTMKHHGANIELIKNINNDINTSISIPENLFNIIIETYMIFENFINFIKKIKDNNNTFNNEELFLYNHIKLYIYKKNNMDIIRNTILCEFRNKEYYIQLDNPYAKYVYDNQKDASHKIINYLLDDNVKAVSLIALPQVGKTGTFVYCTYLALTHPDNDKIYNPENIFIISGLNDNDWQLQTEKDMLPSLKNNVYHLGKLKKFNDKLKSINNSKILIIIDECHIATSENQKIDKYINDNTLDTVDIKYLVVSATPSVIKYELDEWKERHKKVYLNPPSSYIGFTNFIDENRIFDAEEITIDFLEEKFKYLLNTRFIKPKYHIIRLSTKKRSNIEQWILKNNYKKYDIDSDNKIDNINNFLAIIPNKHTFIIIKNFWRAGKRMNDKNIGIVYEYNKDMNYDITAQGLIGRFCGNDKQVNNPTAPIFFCKKETLVKYMEFINGDCNYSTYDYHSSKLKIEKKELKKRTNSCINNIDINNKIEHTHIKKSDYIDYPVELIFDDFEYNKINISKSKNELVLNIIKEKYQYIYNIIKNYNCDKCTIPIEEKNYKRHIIQAREAFINKKIYSADITKKTKDEYLNAYLLFIDHKKDPIIGTHKVYLIIYHGNKHKKLLEN